MPDRICIILERFAKDLIGWNPDHINPDHINPALMTCQEYIEMINRDNEWHPDRAYDMSLEQLNQYDNSNQENYKLIRRFRINGLNFQLMVRIRKNSYNRRDQDGEIVRDDKGMALQYSDAEIKDLGLRPHEFSLAVFCNNKRVAYAEDEWGAMLIVVAREYRGLGLGPLVGKFARSLEPAKPSGGFTNRGYNNLIKIHGEMVRDTMQDGLYSKLVSRGEMTPERAKEIIKSAKIDKKSNKPTVDLSSDDPKNWVLYSDDMGTFILYDTKLKNALDHNVSDHFYDAMIKGALNIVDDQHAGIARIKRFGAETTKLKAFMLALAYTRAQEWGVELWVEPEEYDLPRFTYGPETNVVGHASRQVLSGPTLDYRPLVSAENRYRKSFDKYDEFRYRMHEIADAKY